MFHRLSQFSPLIWTVIGGTFLTRLTYFMVWPFMAILLKEQFDLSVFTIGLILSGAAFTGSSLSFVVGNLSDRFGRRVVMISGTLASAIAFGSLALADQLAVYIVCVLLVGAGYSLLEPPSKAMISDEISDPEARGLAFNLRYYFLNIGAAAGPLSGVYFGLTAQQSTFSLVMATYLIYGLALAYFSRHQPTISDDQKAAAGLAKAWIVLKKDKAFQLLVIANTLIMTCYGQFEATLVQYLGLVRPDDAVGLYATLVMVNAATILIFQFPMLALLRNIQLHNRIYLSLALFALGFSAYAWLPQQLAIAWILATLIMSVGESVLFPTLNIQIDVMAPQHLRGSYFGANAISSFGFSLAPALGGLMLELLDHNAWWVTGALVLVAMALYYLAVKLLPARRQWIAELEAEVRAVEPVARA